MPGSTGGRTPDAPDRGVCAISPSDLVGYTGNLINRVDELEQRIAELEAANVEANQLSDISQQVGWVSGVEYMGIPGWTQTSYGTLIPPTGAGVYYAVTPELTGWFDADGNLLMGGPSFHGSSSGTVSGSLVDAWNAGGISDFLVLGGLSADRGSAMDFGIQRLARGSAITLTNSTTITISQKGLYLFSLIVEGSTPDANGVIQRLRMDMTNNYPFDEQGTEWSGVVRGGEFYISAALVGVVTATPSVLSIDYSGTVDGLSTVDIGSLVIAKIQNGIT